jgi:uncharacterized protein YjbI with pentapeptide repeats
VEFWTQVWATYTANREQIIPLLAPLATFASGFLTVVVGSVVAYAALKQVRIATRQAEIATRQAEIARDRHEEQIKADLQRRITESFTKAVEQLGHTEIQVRVGGIYSLERISQESDRDYWPIMEILTAYVRERAPWNGATLAPSRTENTSQPSSPDPQPMADVAAAITVVGRRKPRQEDEDSERYRLNLRSTDLRGAFLSKGYFKNVIFTEAHLEKASLEEANLQGNLSFAHLENASLSGAHLEQALIFFAHLENASLSGAHLETAILAQAHLEGAILKKAHLEKAILLAAHLEGAHLDGAHLEGVHFDGAHLEGATFHGATGLTQDQIERTFGDAKTELPEGLIPPLKSGRWSGS